MTTATIGHNNPPSTAEILTQNYPIILKEIEDIASRANGLPKTVKNGDDLDAVGVIVKDAKAMIKRVDKARTDEKEPHLTAGREIDSFFKVLTERLDKIATALNDRATVYQREQLAIQRREQEAAAKKAREAEEAARIKADELAAQGKTTAAAKQEAKADLAADTAAEADRKADASNADLARSRGASGTLSTARTTKKVRITDFDALKLGSLGPYLDREAVQKAANQWLRVTKGQAAITGLEVYDDVQASFR